MEITEVEIGLPIYDAKGKRLCEQPYYYGTITEWYTPINRLPAFQFYRLIDTSNPITTANANAEFVLVNSDTGAETDMMAHFTSAQVVTTYTDHEYFKYNSSVAITPDMTTGRYYLRISDGVFTWYSEDFMVCDIPNIDYVIPPSGNYLMVNSTDITLINSSDKVLIN